MTNYFLLILFWFTYFLLHSVLAAEKVKQKLLILGQYYRILYNLIAIGGLIFILLFMALIPPVKLYETTSLSKFLSLIPATYGILVIKSAFKIFSLQEFIGIKQSRNLELKDEFKKEGILQYVRHPLYSGSILIMIGFLIFSPSLGNLTSLICILIYLFIGIRLEEKKLIKLFGEDYIQYKKTVPMLVPKLKHGR